MPIEIVWAPLARARLAEIRAYIARDNPQAADRIATRIVALIETLRVHPRLGRVGARSGIRELVIGGTPYLVTYQVGRKRITISNIWHGAQQRKR